MRLDTDLHRLVWSPDDFDGEGNLLTSAFRKQDLSGGEHYVSVSRVDQADAAAELALAHSQSKRADGIEFIRESAYSALLYGLSVADAQDNNGICPFMITLEPLPVNAAHCGIRNVSGQNGRGYINQLRLLLVELVHQSQELDRFLASLDGCP